MIGGHICSSGRCQTMVSHCGEMVDVGRKRLGVWMQVERMLESCDHTEVATGSPSMSPEKQLGDLTPTGYGHGLGTGRGKQLACQGCRVTERAWEGPGRFSGMPRAPLRQRAVVHESGSGWRASLAGRTASETGAIHGKDFGSNKGLGLKSTPNQ